MTQALDDELLQQLAPSLGFFGGLNMDRQDVAVCRDVISLRIYIDGKKPGYLNLRGIEIRDEKGLIALPEGSFSIQQSSVQKGKPPRAGAALLRKTGIHTGKELHPSWEIIFSQPLPVHQVRIFNRPDAYAVRSQRMVVEVTLEDGTRAEVFRAQSAENLRKAMQVVERTLAIESPDLAGLDPEGASRWRTRVMAELASRVRSKPETISASTWRELIAFTPAWVRRDASDDELWVYAGFLLAQRKIARASETSVKLLAPALGSRAVLKRLDGVINELARLYGMDEVMLTRHGLRTVGLLRRNSPAFLAHMRNTLATLESLGYPAVIAYGTLLGAVRDGRFIIHDDDLDVIYKARSSSRAGVEQEVRELARKLGEAGYKVVELLPKHLNMHVNDPVSGTSLDVFPCWLEDGKMQMHMEKMAIRGIAPEVMFPGSVVQLEGEYFPAPALPESFLQERYGNGWNIPDMYYDWPWPLRAD